MRCKTNVLVTYCSGLYFTIVLIRLSYMWFTPGEEAILTKQESTAHSRRKELLPIVLYNRIPKTGSTSFANLLYDSCMKNKVYVLHVNITTFKSTLPLQDQQEFVRNVSSWYRPAVYHGHFAYVDFQQHGSNLHPHYINIIREPLERLVSHYYFIRYGDDYRVGLKRYKQGENTTFDECVKKGKIDCSDRKMWMQIPFFCGQKAGCLKPGNLWALEEAKKNLKEKYTLVGVTEHLDDFVNLLEKMFPRIFLGITEMYKTGNKSHLRHTLHKDLPSEETLQVFQKSAIYRLEREFYSFAKNHFFTIMATWK